MRKRERKRLTLLFLLVEVKETPEPKLLVFKDKKEALEAFKEFLRDKVRAVSP